MNYHFVFGFHRWRITAAAAFTLTLERIGFGGGMVIDPNGDHPSIFANFMCAFFLATINVRFCAHALEHE